MYKQLVNSIKYKFKSLPVASRSLKNESGNTVLAVLSCVIILGGVLQTTGFGKLTQNQLFSSGARLKESRNNIAYQMERYAALPAAFRNSVPLSVSGNSELRTCVFGSPAGSCVADVAYPLSLHTPYLTATGSLLIAGPGANAPVLYDTRGGLCQTGDTSASVHCPFEVFTTFKAQCPASAAFCPVAESIQVEYIVKIADSILASGGIKEHILDQVKKSATSILTSAIRPPPSDYIPVLNSVNSMFAVGAPPAAAPATPATYEQILQAVKDALEGSPLLSNAATFANDLFYTRNVTDLSVATAYTDLYRLNQKAAYSALGDLGWRTANIVGYVPPTAAQIKSLSDAIAWVPDYTLSGVLGRSWITDKGLVVQLEAAISGATSDPIMQRIVEVRATDRDMAQAINSALTNYDLIGAGSSYGFVYAVKQYGITSATLLNTYASVMMAAGVTSGDVAWAIVQNNVTDVAQAAAMQAAYTASPTPAYTSNPPPAPPPTSPTPPPPTASSTPVPVAMSPVCDLTSTSCSAAPSSF